ncbi:unnamed protein product [Linum tenue]|uniref:F-box domain-containing protein n=1 Tax=Linum tenue TaxID=586396 RepID=A0AAV0HF87_9ROSI|nr:unnamed protein product [Linum tenue]
MSRRVKRRISECSIDEATTLPDDILIQIFSILDYRSRASFAATCQSFRRLGSSPCLWGSLDLRFHKFDTAMANSISSRTKHLSKLEFRGVESADAIVHLRAQSLRELSGEFCQGITDATVSAIAARHKLLQSIQFGPLACEKVSSHGIEAIAHCCPNLTRLHLSGVREVTADAINSLASRCVKLEDVAFMDSNDIDEFALGNLASLRFLSVAGAKRLNWGLAFQHWRRLPNLVGLDVSRTDIAFDSSTRSSWLSLSDKLQIAITLDCPELEEQGSTAVNYYMEKMKHNANKDDDGRMSGFVAWTERALSQSLVRMAENNLTGTKVVDPFWDRTGATLLLHLLRSSEVDVRERAATAIATFVIVDDDDHPAATSTVDSTRARRIMQSGGVDVLLSFATTSIRQGLQIEALKAIANLCMDSQVAKVVAENGGITILSNLMRSSNRFVVEEALGGLWNLSLGEELKGLISETGGTKALVDLIFQWPPSSHGILERAAGTVANLVTDEKCNFEVMAAGGVRALTLLAGFSEYVGVQEQSELVAVAKAMEYHRQGERAKAARALANLVSHGDVNASNFAVGEEVGAVEALVRITFSQHEGARLEAAGALWNLSFDERNREAIAAAGGIVALISLAKSCSNSSHQGDLQERAAGALWGLSVSEANSVAIGEYGGVPPLIGLACSDIEDVHETAAGALWNIAFEPGNALRILQDGGVSSLIHLCSSSPSRMARFMATLALAYLFDGRMDEYVAERGITQDPFNTMIADRIKMIALNHIGSFVLSFCSDHICDTAMLAEASSAALAQRMEGCLIPEVGFLKCSEVEMKRFVAMLGSACPILKVCSSFALFQFTMPNGRYTSHHVTLLQNAGISRIIQAIASSSTTPVEVKVFVKLLRSNLQLHYRLEDLSNFHTLVCASKLTPILHKL